MAEWSKAPDSSVSLPEYGHIEPSGPRMWAWVRIPLLTEHFGAIVTLYGPCMRRFREVVKAQGFRFESNVVACHFEEILRSKSRFKIRNVAIILDRCAGSVAERSKALV